MKKFLVCVFALLVMCGAAFAADPIKLGYIATLTGDGSTWGQHERDSAVMAVKELNAAGGLLGRPVELIVYDIKGKPEDAVNAVRRLVFEDKVVAIGGSNYSGIQLAISSIVNDAKIPTMATSATNPAVTVNPDTGKVVPYMFRMTYTDPYQGKVMADYLVKKLGKKKIAIIGDVGDAYSEGLTEFIKKRCDDFKVEHKFWGFRAGDVDFRAQLTEMKAWGADGLAMTMYYKEMGLVMKQAAELGLKVAFIGGDGYSQSIFEIAGDAAEGSYWVYPLDKKEPAISALLEKFKKEYNREATEYMNVAYAYDVIQIFADAIRRTEAESVVKTYHAVQLLAGAIKSVPAGGSYNDVLKEFADVVLQAGKLDGEAIRNAMENTKDLQLAHFKYTVDKATHNPLNKPAAILLAKNKDTEFVEMWTPQDNF